MNSCGDEENKEKEKEKVAERSDKFFKLWAAEMKDRKKPLEKKFH